MQGRMKKYGDQAELLCPDCRDKEKQLEEAA